MTINNKSERNYRGKCLGWPVPSYGAVKEFSVVAQVLKQRGLKLTSCERTLAKNLSVLARGSILLFCSTNVLKTAVNADATKIFCRVTFSFEACLKSNKKMENNSNRA